MRMRGNTQPVVTFPIPPEAPAVVVEEQARFNQVVAKWAETKDELRAAKQAVIEGKAADVRAAVDAFTAGKEPKSPGAAEQVARVKAEELEARLRALTVAVDQSGNSLAQVIAANREEWVVALAKAEAAAATKLSKAVKEAQAALDALRPSRAGGAWLDTFDAGKAAGGRVPGFAGGQLRVKGHLPGQLAGDHDPVMLLQLIASAVEPPVPTTTPLGAEDAARFRREARTAVGHAG